MTSRQMLSKSLTWGNWLQMSLSYLPGTASLLEELDKKLMVLLRDGRTLIGEQLNTPNGLFLLLFKVEVYFLNKMWIWGRINPEYRKQTWQKCFFVRLPPFCWPVRQSGASPDNREDPRGQVLWWHSSWCFRCERRECRVARGNWRRENRAKRYWSHRGQLGGDFGETGELNSCTGYSSFAYSSPCQAVQQAEKEEADRIRVKAFKERGLTYTAQGDCEDMY